MGKKGKFDKEIWDKRFLKLVAFKKKHGHTVVPQLSMKSLNAWCYTLRQKKDWLSSEQKKKLEKLGFGWSDVFTQKWENRYQELVAFKKKHGHTFVPKSMSSLYAWCRSLRRTKSQLSSERKKKLKKIGFDWVGIKPRK